MAQEALRSRSPAAPTFTLDDWYAMDEDEAGEFVDGRLEQEEEPGFAHELVVTWFGQQFRNWLSGRRGFVAGSDAKFAVGSRRGRKPDVSVYLPGSARPPAQGLIRVPPDVVIEIVSPSPRDARRDRIEKLDEYAAFGVSWYWILDPLVRGLEIYGLESDGKYKRQLGAAGGIVTEVPGCGGLSLNLDELWAELDALEADAATTPPTTT